MAVSDRRMTIGDRLRALFTIHFKKTRGTTVLYIKKPADHKMVAG